MTDLKPPITDAHEPAEDDEEYSEESVNRQENEGDRALLRRLLDHRPDNLKLDAIGKGSAYTFKHLLQPLFDIDLDDTTRFDCPVILFVGQHDHTTSHELAEQWFERVQAPSKRLVLFADSAHMAMLEQPGRFLMHLVTDVLPLAQQAGDAAPAEITRGDGGVL